MEGRTVKGLEEEIERAKMVAGYMDAQGEAVIKVLNVILKQSARLGN